jgi:uncharacterized membrane-anchored protein
VEVDAKEGEHAVKSRFPIHAFTMYAPAGSEIGEAVDAAIAYARQFGCKGRFVFNGVTVNVNPNSDRQKVAHSQQHRQWKAGGSVPA